MLRVIKAGVLMAIVLGLMGVASPASAQVAPAIEVDPSADLLDGHTVGIDVSGYPAGASLGVVQCTAEAVDTNDTRQCDVSQAAFFTADGSGSARISFTVDQLISLSTGTVDCLDVGCVMAVGNVSSGVVTDPAYAPIEFAPGTAPSVDVSPTTGLVGGQSIDVSVTGLPADTSIGVAQCVEGSATLAACDQATLVESVTDGAGGDSLALAAARFLATPAPTDCVPTGCVIGVGTSDGTYLTTTALRFAPVVEVAPATGLVDGQQVQVTGAGLSNGSAGLIMCRADAIDAEGCDVDTLTTTLVGDDGQLSAVLSVSRAIYAPERIDCVQETCSVAILAGSDDFVPTSLGFAPAAPLPPDPITIDIQDQGTVEGAGPAAGRANVQAVATCAMPVELSVFRSITQEHGGVVSFESFSRDVACTPGQPVTVYSSFPGSFGLGPAEVEVSVRARDGGIQVGRAGDRAQVELLDHTAVVQAFQVALADPANVELRAAFLVALQAQLDQDPVFRQEFFAAIING